jgi:hypothetical protein
MTEITIELQDHSKELEQATRILEKVDKEKNWWKDKDMPLKSKKKLVYMISTVLEATGEMSLTRFDIREDLEQQYNKHYLQSPALGKELFLKHYEKLHKPYDKIKNKCFDLLKKVDPQNEIEVE